MQGHQHLLLGTVAGLSGAMMYAEPAAGIAFCAACMIGSIYPDIDVSTSKISKKARATSFVIGHIFGHRGFIHTPFNGLVMYLLLTWITGMVMPSYSSQIVTGFIIGFFLHLLQDTMTKGGIMWFWPLKFKIHLTNLKSSSPVCYVITIIMAAITAGVFIVIARN